MQPHILFYDKVSIERYRLKRSFWRAVGGPGGAATLFCLGQTTIHFSKVMIVNDASSYYLSMLAPWQVQ